MIQMILSYTIRSHTEGSWKTSFSFEASKVFICSLNLNNKYNIELDTAISVE